MEQNSDGPKKRRSKKNKSFEECLASLDDINIPGASSKKKPPVVKFVDIETDCATGQQVTKNRKKYPRDKWKSKGKKNVAKGDQAASSSAAAATEEDVFSDDLMHDPFDGEVSDDNELIEPDKLATIISELTAMENSLPKVESEWEQRKRALDENWSAVRNYLFTCQTFKNSIPKPGSYCMHCDGIAKIKCMSCQKILCVKCDFKIHTEFPFHDRKTWVHGYFEGIGNRQTLTAGDEICFSERPVPVYLPVCPNCQQYASLSKSCVDALVTIVSTKGRFEFNDILYGCSNCSFRAIGCSHLLMVTSGFWPASPQKTTTFYTEDLLELWDSISNNSPGTSLSSFVTSLETLSKNAGRLGTISVTTFGKSYREWAFCRNNIMSETGEDRFCCPVCISTCHSIHIDGHRKTYRFKKVARGTETALYEDIFVENDDDVQQHMKVIYDKMGSQEYQSDKMCGSSFWQAARSHSKSSYTSLDETGLVVAGCRHVLALKSVNMFAGEQYGYALYLHKQLMSSLNMQFVWQDIMCKYWPWLERVCMKLPEMSGLLKTLKALSVMHAKAHSLDCQLVWGGLYQEKAALSTGESMEQFFSYFAKCGLTTKNMNAAARIDTLTEHTGFWNQRKIENFAASLAKQYARAKQKLLSAKSEKSNLCSRTCVEITEQIIETWEHELRRSAQDSSQRQRSSTVVNQIEEYFKVYKELESAPFLQQYVEKTDEASSIISGQEEMYKMLANAQKETDRKTKKLKSLERQLLAGGYEKEELLVDGRKILTERTLDLLKTRIVNNYLNIQQQSIEISRLADTSKKRIKIRGSMANNKKTLETLVDKYNVVSRLSVISAVQLDKGDVASGKFAWQTGEVDRMVPHWLRKQIVDKHVVLKRCQEELNLCITEMQAYVKFYKEKQRALENDIISIDNSISDLASDDVLTPVNLQLNVQSHRMIEGDFTTPTDKDSWLLQLRGMLSLRRLGAAVCRRRLASCAGIFKKALGPEYDKLVPATDEETDDSDDSADEDENNVEEDDDELDSILATV